MTQPLRKSRPLSASRADLDSWLFSPDVEPEVLMILTAYRDAAESLRQASQAATAALETADVAAETVAHDVVAAEITADEASEREINPRVPRGLPAVPRMHSVPGIDAENLAHLHGQLVANGFATVEILGRSDGLAYRLTREGLGQLAGEPATADAA